MERAWAVRAVYVCLMCVLGNNTFTGLSQHVICSRSLGVTSFQRSYVRLFSSLRKQQIQELGWVPAPHPVDSMEDG